MLDKYCFSDQSRVNKAAQFHVVFQSRQRLKSKFGALHLVKNTKDIPRLGVIISKRNVRFSTQRNRIRRVVRETFRLQQFNLPSYDLVFVGYKAGLEASNAEIRQCFMKLLDSFVKRYSGS